jgi:molecular chaperone DnaJ
MNDPYQVLGVSPTATDDEVKKAYRALARKYHPDNYHENPLADLAQEKMKVINEAYEEIQAQRKGRTSSGSAYQGGAGNPYGGNPYGGNPFTGGAYGGYRSQYTGTPAFQRVRMAINQDDLNLAEELLNAMSDRNAEWNYLKGIICTRRGWMDEAKRYLGLAVQMEPDNAEFQRALDLAEGGGAYQNTTGFSTENCGGTNNCLRTLSICLCCSMFGGGSRFLFC